MLTKTGGDLYFMIGYFTEYAKLQDEETKKDAKKILTDIANSNKADWIKRMAKKYATDL